MKEFLQERSTFLGASTAGVGGTEPLLDTIDTRRRRFVHLLPLGVFAAIVGGFAVTLGRDPSRVPSALIGRPVPEFALPPVQKRTLGLSSLDLKGEVSLVNVFASWCVACREEHPIFMELKRDRAVPVHGLNYKDRPGAAAEWLAKMSDPYTRTGADLNGRVAIDWGVYGVPETFVVDRGGVIAHKHIGAVTEQALRETILPVVARLRT